MIAILLHRIKARVVKCFVVYAPHVPTVAVVAFTLVESRRLAISRGCLSSRPVAMPQQELCTRSTVR